MFDLSNPFRCDLVHKTAPFICHLVFGSFYFRYKELETRYEERLRDTKECFKRENNDLQKRLQNWYEPNDHQHNNRVVVIIHLYILLSVCLSVYLPTYLSRTTEVSNSEFVYHLFYIASSAHHSPI